uniref:IGF-like family receptor 1 n=1 Tax=Scleropages formosus TaxID=113540 RepID=A0A8C9SQR6_SCLFO
MTDIILLLVVAGDVLTDARSLLSADEAYSERCSHDLTTYWDWQANECRSCLQLESLDAGHEFSANCGQDDHSGTRTHLQIPCRKGTYNDGTHIKCQDCKVCSPEEPTLMECSTTRDTQCCGKGEQVISGRCLKMTASIETSTTPIITQTPTTVSTGNYHTYSSPASDKGRLSNVAPHVSTSWIFPVVISLVVISFAALFLVLKRRRRGAQFESIGVQREPSDGHVSIKGSLLHLETNSHQPTTSDVKHLLPNVMEPCNILAFKTEKAPVSVVLDNLDVLEELVMLLDPEHPGTKSTRHVAARCGFSATWVNYAYSMRDTRSPLRAVIEGVTAKFPEWTVGDLAKVFIEIGRNDAVAVLTKLSLLGDC